MKVWVNGKLHDPEDARVSVWDHGMLVGDGVFETVKAVHGEPFALSRHLRRLARSAAGLGLPEPDAEALRAGVAEVLAAAPDWPLARIRITYTSGPGPLGSDRGAEGTTATIIAAEQKPFPPTAKVCVVPWRRNEHGALAGLKTVSYADNVIALAYAKKRGGGEAIFGNLAGDLCEGTGSNVFVVRDGRLITPPLSSGCLAGVTRELVLEWCGGEEENLPLSEFTSVSEAFLTSTTRDVQPIAAIDDVVLPAAPGPVTAKVMQTFAARAAEHSDP
ncbi:MULTISPECIES: aminotransferase class IV [Thermomonospora]|uniref:aminodeoxychorismate lyase n=1 Tax=Thermomonospora curvata (strain ATCC 19995 / DSM 43183 / JCM 3096 / KCTC 9072 / NBRC 15933 / NCIMB 10081 / Henssen B9) TaxID=471852 RepID=D1AEN8_THECD|nr:MULTISPECIES: aminotransferase class IV [Thermomonospora]ACY97613.1 aminotransferase class IV [Thermomonospora curvata DSM 43183]